ncbi:hypothetical protein [Actinoplanes sp. NPDC049118]|uniref:hypothetical protein n=1 Tax=Actinoplanes sp. NPDC049118 TaxID=3155769 RepID=UPI0033D5E7AB
MATVRLEESMDDLDLLRAEFSEWFGNARTVGVHGQHQTQLQSLGSVLEPACAEIRDQLLARDGDGSVGDAYERCRRADQQINLLRRLWRWYADRFDQRHDDTFGDALRAADEIVWSSWREMFGPAVHPEGLPPAPLAAIAPVDVATASPRTEVPQELRAPRDPLLAKWTAAMPIPTITLPSVVVRRPWWLIVAVHECGHQAHAEALRSGIAMDATGPALADAAAAAGAGIDEQESWSLWAGELAADAWAVTLCGTAPIWSVMELERRSDDRLLESPGRAYPPPLVRWAVANLVAGGLGLGAAADEHRGLADSSPYVGRLLQRAPAVAAALLDTHLGTTTLRQVGAGTPQWQVEALRWRTALPAKAAPFPQTRVESARLCAAGGALVWQESAGRASGDVAAERARLASRLLDVLPNCRPPGRRRAAQATKQVTAATELVLADLRSAGW